jgi:hypothetical protein
MKRDDVDLVNREWSDLLNVKQRTKPRLLSNDYAEST